MPGAPGNEGCARVSIGTAPIRNWCTLGEMQRCSRAPRHQLVQQACKAAGVQSSSCAKQQLCKAAGACRAGQALGTLPHTASTGCPMGTCADPVQLGSRGC